jgi:hypothetical protein
VSENLARIVNDNDKEEITTDKEIKSLIDTGNSVVSIIEGTSTIGVKNTPAIKDSLSLSSLVSKSQAN